MRKLIAGCGILAGVLVMLVQSPSIHVRAQEQSPAQKPAPRSTTQATHKVDPTKEADIRQLMELTGAKNLGSELTKAGLEQFRSSVMESQPDNPRARQFVEAFEARFHKHFDANELNETAVAIYDKYLSEADLKGLLEYYNSPLGQRMLKVLPELTRETQDAGYTLGQKAVEQSMEDLRTEYPEFVSNSKDDHRP